MYEMVIKFCCLDFMNLRGLYNMTTKSNQADGQYEQISDIIRKCQEEYVSHIDRICSNPEVKKIILDLKSYFVKVHRPNTMHWENMQVDNVDKDDVDVANPYNKITFGSRPETTMLVDYQQKRMERILDSDARLKNTGAGYKRRLIYDCCNLALQTIAKQKSMSNVIGICSFSKGDPMREFSWEYRYSDSVRDRKIQLSFENLNIDDIPKQENQIDEYFLNETIWTYIDSETHGPVILKELLRLPDFINMVSNFSNNINNPVCIAVNRGLSETNNGLSKKQLELLEIFYYVLLQMSYEKIKDSLTESNIGTDNEKKLYEMMLWMPQHFKISYDPESIVNMYRDGIIDFQEMRKRLAHAEENLNGNTAADCYCAKILSKFADVTAESSKNSDDEKHVVDSHFKSGDDLRAIDEVSYEVPSFSKDPEIEAGTRDFIVTSGIYLRHDYQNYPETVNGQHNNNGNSKTLIDITSRYIDCYAQKNGISDETSKVFKENLEDACNVNFFGVAIQFFKNFFARLFCKENKPAIWGYNNIKADRMFDNTIKLLPQILLDNWSKEKEDMNPIINNLDKPLTNVTQGHRPGHLEDINKNTNENNRNFV